MSDPRGAADSPFGSSPDPVGFVVQFVPTGGAPSRSALLLLMEYGQAQGAPLVTLVDVRRHDERALYGSMGQRAPRGGAVTRALLMPPDDFLRAFHFQPGPDDVVVVHSRRQTRGPLQAAPR